MPDPTVEEQRWLQGLQDASFGVWDLDPRLEMVHYSPQWKARLGFPRIHAPDSTAFWRCRVHPEDLEPMLIALRAHLDGYSASYEMRFRLRCNGSGYRTVQSRGRVVARDHRGQATRMVGTMIDLTGRPSSTAPHGLAAEVASPVTGLLRVPLHATLGVTYPLADAGGLAVADETLRLVDQIDDLLDLALREGSAAA